MTLCHNIAQQEVDLICINCDCDLFCTNINQTPTTQYLKQIISAPALAHGGVVQVLPINHVGEWLALMLGKTSATGIQGCAFKLPKLGKLLFVNQKAICVWDTSVTPLLNLALTRYFVRSVSKSQCCSLDWNKRANYALIVLLFTAVGDSKHQ